MALSGRERRELREIEQALILQYPGLARQFSAAAGHVAERGPVRTVRLIAGTLLTVIAVLLLSSGLIQVDLGLLLSGCLVLVITPVLLLLIGWSHRGHE